MALRNPNTNVQNINAAPARENADFWVNTYMIIPTKDGGTTRVQVRKPAIDPSTKLGQYLLTKDEEFLAQIEFEVELNDVRKQNEVEWA